MAVAGPLKRGLDRKGRPAETRPLAATCWKHEKDEGLPGGEAFLDKAPGGDLLLHGKATLPSAHARFTSEFGMGSGGTTPLWPPGKGLKRRKCAGFSLETKPF